MIVDKSRADLCTNMYSADVRLWLWTLAGQTDVQTCTVLTSGCDCGQQQGRPLYTRVQCWVGVLQWMRRAFSQGKRLKCRCVGGNIDVLAGCGLSLGPITFLPVKRRNWKYSSACWGRCFVPSQPQRTTSGLNTNFTLSPSYSFHKSSYHKPVFYIYFFYSLFIFRGHSTWEPASGRETCFILRAYTGTTC